MRDEEEARKVQEAVNEIAEAARVLSAKMTEAARLGIETKLEVQAAHVDEQAAPIRYIVGVECFERISPSRKPE